MNLAFNNENDAREYLLDGVKVPSVIVKQTPEMVEYALSFMIEELGLVEALELYSDTCGINAV